MVVTHRAGQFTGVPQPAWGTGTGAVRGAAGCPIGTDTSLIAVQAPRPTGTWQGTVRALPPWGEGQRYHLAMPSMTSCPLPQLHRQHPGHHSCLDLRSWHRVHPIYAAWKWAHWTRGLAFGVSSPHPGHGWGSAAHLHSEVCHCFCLQDPNSPSSVPSSRRPPLRTADPCFPAATSRWAFLRET